MKKSIVIACQTLQDEIEMICRDQGVTPEIKWMDNTLHAFPEKLKAALQETIDTLRDVDEIRLAYGNCGNGLAGLTGNQATLVIPAFADCIAMLLWKREDMNTLRTNTYFLTKGWLDSEKGLEWEMAYNKKRYGEKRAKQINQILYENYSDLMLIRTGAYDPESIRSRINLLAHEMEMEVVESDGDLTPLENLLLGREDDSFIRVKPGEFSPAYPVGE